MTLLGASDPTRQLTNRTVAICFLAGFCNSQAGRFDYNRNPLLQNAFMRLPFGLCLWAALLIASSEAESGGLSVSNTRLIMHDGQTSAATVFANETATQFLTRAWIEDRAGRKIEDFVVTPPVAFSPPGKHIRLQVTLLYPEKYPADKETLFYLRTNSVPGSYDKNANTLQIEYGLRVKVFYRPKALSGTMLDSIKGLRWRISGRRLIAENPSNFNVTVAAYSINGNTKQLDDCVIAPGAAVQFALPDHTPDAFRLVWASMDDYGTAVKSEADIKDEKP